MNRFLLSSTLNTRDLGGYKTSNGRVTSCNVYLRSDVPALVSEADIELLLSNNITTIVDLRNDEEVKRKPCGLKDHGSFEYYHCKIHGDGRLPENVEAVPHSYFEMIDEQKTVLNILKVFAKSKGGVLYHCTAGKDRTGVISALLLMVAGVCKEEILADYNTSQVYLDTMLRQYCESNNGVDINIIIPKKEYMEKFLEMFLSKYGSVEEYLRQIGLREDEVRQLKMKLI